MDLEGKVAIVTAGGGLNIGRSYCKLLARNGASVVVADIDLNGAKETAAEIVAEGGKATAIQIDVSKTDEVQKMVDFAIQSYGDVDILVNHAGTGVNKPVDEVTDELWDRAIGISLRGTFACVRAVVPSMKRRGAGRIISTVSRAAYRPMAKSAPRGIATYSAAKAGIVGFTRAIAMELGPYNITANCIAPGLTGRSGTYAVMGGARPSLEDRQKEAIAEGQVLPLGVVDPDDIAGALLYLVGPYGSRVTGVVMHVNSGAYFPA